MGVSTQIVMEEFRKAAPLATLLTSVATSKVLTYKDISSLITQKGFGDLHWVAFNPNSQGVETGLMHRCLEVEEEKCAIGISTQISWRVATSKVLTCDHISFHIIQKVFGDLHWLAFSPNSHGVRMELMHRICVGEVKRAVLISTCIERVQNGWSVATSKVLTWNDISTRSGHRRMANKLFFYTGPIQLDNWFEGGGSK